MELRHRPEVQHSVCTDLENAYLSPINAQPLAVADSSAGSLRGGSRVATNF